MPEPDFAALAERMLRDYDARDPGTVFGEGLRLSVDDAWKLQAAVADLREQRGEQLVGYKIGAINPANQRSTGLSHPVWARLWSTEQHVNGAKLSKRDFANIAIEGEFAVTLGRDINPDSVTIDTFSKSIDRIFPVIELHNLMMRGEPPRGHELIANNAIHAGVVRGVGSPAPATSLSTDLVVLFDGEVVDSWPSLSWPRDILRAVVWMVGKLAADGRRIRKGETLLTGAFGPALPLGEKTHVEVVSSAFGYVEATIT